MSSKKIIPGIAVSAICKNEAHIIGEFIQQLIDWVEEIIIVDDSSEDQTAQIIKEYQSKFPDKITYHLFQKSEKQYLSHLRNFGISLCRSNWILHMDIDERISKEFYLELRSIFLEGNSLEAYDAFRFKRLNYFLGKPMNFGDLNLWNKVHLARKSILKFEGLNHELVQVNTSNTRIGQMRSRMIHLNEPLYIDRIDKSRRYLNDLVQEITNKYHKIFGFYFVLLFPILYFLRLYFFKLGLFDGRRGLIWAIHSGIARFQACVVIYHDNSIQKGVIK
jgi:glycosyltransferase involved in cell wall biosynthesis